MTTRVRSFEEECLIEDRVTAGDADTSTLQAQPKAKMEPIVRAVACRFPQIIGALQRDQGMATPDYSTLKWGIDSNRGWKFGNYSCWGAAVTLLSVDPDSLTYRSFMM